MRKVICNSTPLIALNKISKLELLEILYGEIIIPFGVYEEVILESKYNKDLDFVKNSRFIRIENIKNQEAKKFFATSLHKGEVEVMILAREIGADLCVIDDFLARKYAKFYGFNITGTIGIILKAKERGDIEFVKPLLDELLRNNIYISDELYKEAIRIAKEY